MVFILTTRSFIFQECINSIPSKTYTFLKKCNRFLNRFFLICYNKFPRNVQKKIITIFHVTVTTYHASTMQKLQTSLKKIRQNWNEVCLIDKIVNLNDRDSTSGLSFLRMRTYRVLYWVRLGPVGSSHRVDCGFLSTSLANVEDTEWRNATWSTKDSSVVQNRQNWQGLLGW